MENRYGISSAKYTITTITSMDYFAESEDDFYYTIIGTRGSTSEYNTDDRELGQTDTYTITDDTDIGEFRCVSVRLEGTDGWLITEVRVPL